nr:ribonuclease H-like domain-containing protein [Tanacetum cinerariifolium]
MLLCKQEEAGFQSNAKQADWRDDTDDEPEDQELEAHYMYMAHIQEVTLDSVDNSGPIFDVEPLQKVQNNNNNYNVFSIESEHTEQPESVNDTYPVNQDEHNIIIDSLDMIYDREQDDHDDNDDLAKERDLLASLIEKLKCEIDDSKNRNEFLKSSNKTLIDKLKGTDKNDKAFKENRSKVFLKECEQYFEIQDFKAQLHEKIIAISELKKLIEEMKGKSMETKFEKPLVIRQPNDFKSQRQSVLGKPKFFLDSLEKKDFSNDFSKPVTTQILPQNCGVNFKEHKFDCSQNLVEIILFIVDSGCSKHMTGNLKLLSNFVEQFLGSHGIDPYSITLQDTSTPNLICLMAKASSSQEGL